MIFLNKFTFQERKSRIQSKDTDAGKTELRLLDADFQNFKSIRIPKICAVLHQLSRRYNMGKMKIVFLCNLLSDLTAFILVYFIA